MVNKDLKWTTFLIVLLLKAIFWVEVALILMKLCRVITWSWWWVIAPGLLPFSIIIILLLGIFMLIATQKGF